jgi:hypothetical protein
MTDGDCKGCARSATANLPEVEVQRLLALYVADHPGAVLVDDMTYGARLDACRSCSDLQFGGTTCRHCGCLIAVRAKLAEKICPGPQERWASAVNAGNSVASSAQATAAHLLGTVQVTGLEQGELK